MSHTTIGRYLDLFVDTMMLRRLQPLHVDLGKRLVKSPKVYDVTQVYYTRCCVLAALPTCGAMPL